MGWAAIVYYLPLSKVDGMAFLIRGLYKKPIDLAAVQNQSLELWPESLKAGDLRFLYRSLMVLNTDRDSGLLSWRPPAGRLLLRGPFHPNYCGVGSYRILPLRKVDGMAFLIRGLYKKPIDLAAIVNPKLFFFPVANAGPCEAALAGSKRAGRGSGCQGRS